MDISYLLWLQDLRTLTQDALTPLLKGISAVGESYAFLLPIFIYWCWDKRRGLLTLAAVYLCMALTTVIKITACVYRPWIKDPRILPVGKLPASYSFPSGHTSMASTVYLGSAVTFWHKKYVKWVAVVCVVAALLTGFSRNYLGVHTPQDVLAGFVLSLACLYSVWKLGDYLYKHPEQENKILLLTALLTIGALVYACYKTYPMDYVNGKLLVNPHKAIRSTFEGMGALGAFCVARYIEKTWIRFQATGLHVKGICYGIVGLILFGFLFHVTKKPLFNLMGKDWGRFTWAAGLVFYVMVLYPLILKHLYSPANNKH